MKSYAQNGEDLVARHIFDRIGIEKPSYLDIGAYHPFELNHTALFYERGSRGINVEANPALMEAFRKARPEDVNVCAAIGTQRGRAPFHLDHHSLIRFSSADCPVIEVDVLTVDEIVDTQAGGVFPDFLTIDIEGMDLAVLQSIEYWRHAPKVICAEVGTDASGKYVDVSPQLCRTMNNYGFSAHHRVDNNLFFVTKQFMDRLF